MTGQHTVAKLCPVRGAMQVKESQRPPPSQSPHEPIDGFRSEWFRSDRQMRCRDAWWWANYALKYSWMRRRGTPASSRCVAQEWRRVCTEARLWIPLALRATLNASCTLERGMGTEAVDMPIPPRPGAGKSHTGWTMGGPVLPEQLQGPLGQWHVTVFGTFAAAHVDQHAGTVNIGDLQVGALLQAQPTGVNSAQTHPIAQQLEVCQNGTHFFDTAG